MGTKTGIAWTDHTFNAWIGCQKVSDGCKHCYAEHSTPTRRARARGLELWGPGSARMPLSEAYWSAPHKWNADALMAGQRRRVFCSSLADVFEDHPHVVGHRERLFEVIKLTPALDWQLLTKRPENVPGMVPGSWMSRHWPFNAWMGTTTENEANLQERARHLLNIPAHIRFLSAEPLLGPLALRPWRGAFHWVILGGESAQGGARARPCDIGWIRYALRDCKAEGVPVFVKQLGASVCDGASTLIFTGKAGDPSEWPEDLRVQEFPRSKAE